MVLSGVVAALAGFSYALATSLQVESRGAGSGVAVRSVGTGLRFSNPFVLGSQAPEFPSGGDFASDPDAFDLGDACFGSQITRHLTALGGVSPYLFTSTTIGSTTSTGLALDPTGRVHGAVPSGGPAPATFTAKLTDAAGATRTGAFRLNTLSGSSLPLRFAHDRLSDAQVGSDYITNIEALNGNTSDTTYSASGVTLNGVALSNLEQAGLTLFSDGTLAGRPLDSGTLAFTAQALQGGARALNRAGTAFNQSFSISIAAATRVQSALAATSAGVKGGRPGRDTLNYTALINTDGLRASDFGGESFVFRFAGATFSTTLDSSGQGRSGNLRVKLSGLDGKLTVQLRNQDFSQILPSSSLVNGDEKNLVVQIQIGSNYLGAEAIGFNVKNRRGRFQLGYRLGKDIQLGGLFQVVSVRTADFFSSSSAFKIRFLISHVRGNTTRQFGAPTDATVHLGRNFSQTVRLFRGRGIFAPDGLRTLKINTKTKVGDLTTYPLTQAETGIPPASQSNGQQQTLLFGLDLTTDRLFISGDASRRLTPFFH
jgi:hypothetical protein